MKTQIHITNIGLSLALIFSVASKALAVSITMTFDNAPPGTWEGDFVREATYEENGIVATCFSDHATFADRLLTGNAKPLYFHGPYQYIEFRLANGGLFDLNSFDLVSNGYEDRWLQTSKSAEMVPIGAPLAWATVTFSGDQFSGLNWIRIGTVGAATEVDNFTLSSGGLSITNQPESQLGYWGKIVSFSVEVAGGLPPYAYQWRKDALDIPDATNSVLTLTNLQVTNAGIYTVLVSDTVTDVLSQPATLTVNPAGVSITLYAGITIDGVVGQTYGVQSTTDLGNTNSWAGRANVMLTNVTQIWYDSQPASNPQHYYRVVAGPISLP